MEWLWGMTKPQPHLNLSERTVQQHSDPLELKKEIIYGKQAKQSQWSLILLFLIIPESNWFQKADNETSLPNH